VQGPATFNTFTQIIIYGSGPATGLFIYNGVPALGNPPILSAVPPGVTTDPVGNTVQQTLTIGQDTSSNVRIDGLTGRINLNNASNLTTIRLDPGNEMIGFYPPGSGLGHLGLSVSSQTGTDASGNSIDAGIDLISVPLLVYSGLGSVAAGNLTSSVAIASGTNVVGDHYVGPGVGSYSNSSGVAALLSGGELELYSGSLAAGWTLRFQMFYLPGTTQVFFQGVQRVFGGVGGAPCAVFNNPGVASSTAVTGIEIDGAMALANAAVPASVAGYTEPFANAGHLDYVATDGLTYDTGRLTQVLVSAQLVNSLTAATVITFSSLAASSTWEVEGDIFYTPGAALGAPVFSWLTTTGFTTFTMGMEEFINTLGSSAAAFVNGTGDVMNARTNTLTGITFATGGTRHLQIRGTIITNASVNSLALQAACTIAADTYTILAGSKLKILPVVA
jgi:hypothetical protein